MMNYRVAPLDETLSRREFDCGVPALNRYLHERAGQDIRKYYTAVFVAIETSTKKILGYYTLSNASVNLGDMPEHLKRALPKYAEIPAIRLGRLAGIYRYALNTWAQNSLRTPCLGVCQIYRRGQ
jgi:hypothetical protein